MAFRLKCKKYVSGGREYLVASAISKGPMGGVMVFAMSDDDMHLVAMTAEEYNALPYHWFEDVGPAPKGTAVKPIAL